MRAPLVRRIKTPVPGVRCHHIPKFRTPKLKVDHRQVFGTLLMQVEETMAWLRELLPARFEITGTPRRDVIWEYPLEAVREVIVNAVWHRNYLRAAHIQVRL